MFSAPASFVSMPIESVFKYLKLTDFSLMNLRDDFKVKGIENKDLTKKQLLLCQVSDFLLNNKFQKMNAIFHERLLNLAMFLAEKRV